MKPNKSEILGSLIFHSLLVLYALFLVWFLYISPYNLFDLDAGLRLYLEPIKGTMGYTLTLISCALGWIIISMGYYQMIEALFYPTTKEEKELNNKIRNIRNTLPRRKARYEIRRLRAKFQYEKELLEINNREKRK